ncbi:piggyBac transposable element-derived protein 4-like [Engraulis encrasicolus]|uniref:piggyBac transposable element-derived protein 4-like n=1 Tax=Engraulis encrasicolus TaxID=184585 RepID=UPI002FD385F5
MPTGLGQSTIVKEEENEEEQQQPERNPTPGSGEGTGISLSLVIKSEDTGAFLEGKDYKFDSDCEEEWQLQAYGGRKRRREEEEERDRDEDEDEDGDGDEESEEDDDDHVLVVMKRRRGAAARPRGRGRGTEAGRSRGRGRGRGRGISQESGRGRANSKERGGGRGGRGRGRGGSRGRGRAKNGEVPEDVNVEGRTKRGRGRGRSKERGGKGERGRGRGRGGSRGRGRGRGRPQNDEVEDNDVEEIVPEPRGQGTDRPKIVEDEEEEMEEAAFNDSGEEDISESEDSGDHLLADEEDPDFGCESDEEWQPQAATSGKAKRRREEEEEDSDEEEETNQGKEGVGRGSRGGRGGKRGGSRGRGRGRLKNDEMPEDDAVEIVEKPRDQDTGGLKTVEGKGAGEGEGAGGEGQKPGEDGKPANVNENEDSRDEDEDSDLEGADDDADWVPSREEAEGDEEEEDEEAAVGSSSSKKNVTGQPRGSAASRVQGSTVANKAGGPWLDEGTEDILPPQPNFWPLRTPGPQIMQQGYKTLQLFRLFFTDGILRTVVRNTNKYGALHYADRWSDITLPDLFSYMSMLIFMGLTPLPTVSDYWRRSIPYNLPFPRSVIARRKFELISRALCMSDPDDDAANEARRGTPEYDCLQKIKPMYTELREACKNNFHPYQHIRVDEKAVCRRVQKDKKNKLGFKLFVLADSRCGYMFDFYVNEVRSEMAPGKGLSYDAVMELVSTKALGSGYKLYVDNFYNSSELFKDLLQQKVWACGTVRTKNSKGFPTDRPGSLDKKSPRGSIRWIREDPLLFVQWRDNCDVQMCSTMHQAHAGETVQKKVKVAGGKWLAKDIPVPPAVKDYSKHMGLTDHSDAVIGNYNVWLRTKKWYRALFFYFMDIAIVNAFILHKEIALSKGETAQTQQAFREDLLMELSEAGSPTTVVMPPTAPIRGMHLPEYYSGDSTTGRTRCIACRLKSPIKCVACDVVLCLVPSRNCYSQWHRQKIP